MMGRRLRRRAHGLPGCDVVTEARRAKREVIVMKTETKTDRVQSTAQALASFDREYLLTLARLYHIDVWDDLITKEALVAIIAHAVWN